MYAFECRCRLRLRVAYRAQLALGALALESLYLAVDAGGGRVGLSGKAPPPAYAAQDDVGCAAPAACAGAQTCVRRAGGICFRAFAGAFATAVADGARGRCVCVFFGGSIRNCGCADWGGHRYVESSNTCAPPACAAYVFMTLNEESQTCRMVGAAAGGGGEGLARAVSSQYV